MKRLPSAEYAALSESRRMGAPADAGRYVPTPTTLALYRGDRRLSRRPKSIRVAVRPHASRFQPLMKTAINTYRRNSTADFLADFPPIISLKA